MPLITRDKERFVNSTAFFLEKIECDASNFERETNKVSILLFFLDFEHYKLTGRSVTGSIYVAKKNGPVPKDKYNIYYDPFDKAHFSRRQIDIMCCLVEKHKRSSSEDMLKGPYFDGLPWDVFCKKKGLSVNDTVPYELLTIDSDDREIFDSMKKESEEFKKAFA